MIDNNPFRASYNPTEICQTKAVNNVTTTDEATKKKVTNILFSLIGAMESSCMNKSPEAQKNSSMPTNYGLNFTIKNVNMNELSFN